MAATTTSLRARRSREKGAEREVVHLHTAMGIRADRGAGQKTGR